MFTLVTWLLLSSSPLGAAAFARGDYAVAEKFFLAAWQLHPDANTASNLGAVSRRLHKLADAERWFDTVFALRLKQLGASHADTVIALNNRGVARLALGHPHQARADLEAALARVRAHTADHAAILANLGDVALQQARLGEASRLCLQAFQIDPGRSRACREGVGRVAISAVEH